MRRTPAIAVGCSLERDCTAASRPSSPSKSSAWQTEIGFRAGGGQERRGRPRGRRFASHATRPRASGLFGGRCEAFDGLNNNFILRQRGVRRAACAPHRTAQDTTATTAFAQTADESLTSSPSTFRPGSCMRRFVRCPQGARCCAACLPASHERRAGGRASGTGSDLRQPCAVGPLPTRYHEVSRPCGAMCAPSPSDRTARPALSAPPTRTANPTPVSLLPLRQIPDAP